MKRGLFLCAVSFFVFSAFMSGRGGFPDTGSGSARAGGVPEGDIWVYGGKYYYWFASGVKFGAEIELQELEENFLGGSAIPAYPLNAGNPISGTFGGRSIYVLDDTPVFFGEVSLGGGGLYGFDNLRVMSGTVRAGEVRAAGGVFVNNGCELYVSGELHSGGALECFGGKITADSIESRRVWFDSADGPLFVSVTGGLITGYYTQAGGEVNIGEGLFSVVPPGGDGRAGVSVSREYALYNPASLVVGGDIMCMGADGNIEIGGGTVTGCFDETALAAFETLRSEMKNEDVSVYDAQRSDADTRGVKVTVGGDIRAARSVSAYSGKTLVSGTVEVMSTEGYIGVYGGELGAINIRSAGGFYVGSENDYYGANDEIVVDIAQEIFAAGEIKAIAGQVYEAVVRTETGLCF